MFLKRYKRYSSSRESGVETASVFLRDTCQNKLKEVEYKIIGNSYENELAGVRQFAFMW